MKKKNKTEPPWQHTQGLENINFYQPSFTAAS